MLTETHGASVYICTSVDAVLMQITDCSIRSLSKASYHTQVLSARTETN
jgi:hypothetical protein